MKLIVSFCPSIIEVCFHLTCDWTSELKGMAFFSINSTCSHSDSPSDQAHPLFPLLQPQLPTSSLEPRPPLKKVSSSSPD